MSILHAGLSEPRCTWAWLTCGRACMSISCWGATCTRISRMLRASDFPWQSKQATLALTLMLVLVTTILEGASSWIGASSMSSSSSSASWPPAQMDDSYRAHIFCLGPNIKLPCSFHIRGTSAGAGWTCSMDMQQDASTYVASHAACCCSVLHGSLCVSQILPVTPFHPEDLETISETLS